MRPWTGSSLVQVTPCPYSVLSHYLNQCTLLTIRPLGNFKWNLNQNPNILRNTQKHQIKNSQSAQKYWRMSPNVQVLFYKNVFLSVVNFVNLHIVSAYHLNLRQRSCNEVALCKTAVTLFWSTLLKQRILPLSCSKPPQQFGELHFSFMFYTKFHLPWPICPTQCLILFILVSRWALPFTHCTMLFWCSYSEMLVSATKCWSKIYLNLPEANQLTQWSLWDISKILESYFSSWF